jgi:hypothetical protein
MRGSGRRSNRVPIIVALAVLILLIGGTLYLAFGPGASRVHDAAISNLIAAPSATGPEPFRIVVEAQNRGGADDQFDVRGSVSPADSVGMTTIGPITTNVLRPGETQSFTIPFYPDPNADYVISVGVSLKGGTITDVDPVDNQFDIGFPVYRWRATLTIEIIRDVGSTTVSIPVPPVGISGGVWANHTLDLLGLPGVRAPMFALPNPQNVSVSDGTVHIAPIEDVKEFTLGDFFDLWGQKLTDSCVSIEGYIDKCSGDAGVLIMEVNSFGVSTIRDHVIQDGQDLWLAYVER